MNSEEANKKKQAHKGLGGRIIVLCDDPANPVFFGKLGEDEVRSEVDRELGAKVDHDNEEKLNDELEDFEQEDDYEPPDPSTFPQPPDRRIHAKIFQLIRSWEPIPELPGFIGCPRGVCTRDVFDDWEDKDRWFGYWEFAYQWGLEHRELISGSTEGFGPGTGSVWSSGALELRGGWSVYTVYSDWFCEAFVAATKLPAKEADEAFLRWIDDGGGPGWFRMARIVPDDAEGELQPIGGSLGAVAERGTPSQVQTG